MKASKNLALLCLVFCFVFQSGGCSQEPSSSSEKTPIASKTKEQAKQNDGDELKEEQAKLNSSPTQATVETSADNNWGVLMWSLVGLVGLSVLSLIGWLAIHFWNEIKQEREATDSSFNVVKNRQKELQSQIEYLDVTVKSLSRQLAVQQSEIQSLHRQLEDGGTHIAPQKQAFYEQPIYEPESRFPVAAEDYLNKVRSNSQTAAVDHYTDLLVQDASKGDEFLIVKDDTLSDGLSYAVPNVARFSTKSDYLTYYQNYYACNNPSGGAVWIKSPTTVLRVDGGWKLQDMGELEIR